ncbi:hypothetical protein CYMTET_11341 [Cymbomonas tetramitiformis]|uniref:Uncharacterized protein n=1 Tax=Cymbomonas tetramitiformis TaxID=36881 RepID=A0AAE0GMW6_9CHLO|nr:hypothetical protein CYMTET_11341 [Cymbomonas tetramitiformis]
MQASYLCESLYIHGGMPPSQAKVRPTVPRCAVKRTRVPLGRAKQVIHTRIIATLHGGLGDKKWGTLCTLHIPQFRQSENRCSEVLRRSSNEWISYDETSEESGIERDLQALEIILPYSDVASLVRLHPEILEISTVELARRLCSIKSLLPGITVSSVARSAPKLLLLETTELHVAYQKILDKLAARRPSWSAANVEAAVQESNSATTGSCSRRDASIS